MNHKISSTIIYFYIFLCTVELCYNTYLITLVMDAIGIRYIITSHSLATLSLISFIGEVYCVAYSNKTCYIFGKKESQKLLKSHRTHILTFNFLFFCTVAKLITNACLFYVGPDIDYITTITFNTVLIILGGLVWYIIHTSIIELKEYEHTLWNRLCCIKNSNIVFIV